MNILAVDTSYNKLVVVAKCGDTVAFRIYDEGMKKNNSLILPAIDEVIDELHITLRDIDYFACVVGPGSFTGVRIGVSTLNAFMHVYGKPLVAVTSLELLAYNIKSNKFMTCIDARHDNYYSAVFEGDFTSPKEYICNTKQDLDNFEGQVVIRNNSDYDINALLGVVEYKINIGQFVDVLRPVYMKDSQAEREYNAKNM